MPQSRSASRTVTLLGSTGSVGTQALDVVRAHPDRFEVTGLAAGGADPRMIAAQVLETGARTVALARPEAAAPLAEAIEAGARAQGRRVPDVEILSGPLAATNLAAQGGDVVLNGITGSVGLGPTLAALRAGSTLALANKESLVVGGDLVRRAQVRADQIVPVDSEHSAIAQCLRSGTHAEVARLVLTASGGPFRGRTRAELAEVTAAQALAHPTWSMGPVVTINSASMVNKSLELIEAHLLFDIPVDRIAIAVHPQSMVHSMVEFVDGSTIAQVSPPDMRLPIALGLSWPERLDRVGVPCDWTQASSWTFEPLDESVFGAVRLARAAVATSATHPAVFNAANEECVESFLAGQIGFLEIVETIDRVLGEHAGTSADELSLEAVLAADTWARARAHEVLGAR